MPVDALDTPIERATLNMLSKETLDKWLEEVRQRRLHVVRKLQATRATKRKAQIADVVLKYNRLHVRAQAHLEKLDESLEKLETMMHKMRALELELDEDDYEPESGPETVRAEAGTE